MNKETQWKDKLYERVYTGLVKQDNIELLFNLFYQQYYNEFLIEMEGIGLEFQNYVKKDLFKIIKEW